MRRIFFAGLNNKNNKLPPEDSGLYMLVIGMKNGDFGMGVSCKGAESATVGDKLIKADKKEEGVAEVHLYQPDNLVIADFNWLKKNWTKVENWHENAKGGSRIEDCHYFLGDV